jgi:Bacterial regulatory helix-turn-helix protein, lysR family
VKTLVDLTGMALFVTIVESGSLSAAGRALSMPKATVSRQLELLEKRLGAHRSRLALMAGRFACLFQSDRSVGPPRDSCRTMISKRGASRERKSPTGR